jgi:hypothetical protein
MTVEKIAALLINWGPRSSNFQSYSTRFCFELSPYKKDGFHRQQQVFTQTCWPMFYWHLLRECLARMAVLLS